MDLIYAYGFSVDSQTKRIFLNQGTVKGFNQSIPQGNDGVTKGTNLGVIVSKTSKVGVNAANNLVYNDIKGIPYTGKIDTYGGLAHDEQGRLLVDSVGEITSYYKGLAMTKNGFPALDAEPVVIPGAPTLISASAVSKTKVNVEFSEPQTGTKPFEYVGRAVGGGKVITGPLGEVAVKGSFFGALEGLTGGTDYSITVFAKNAAGQGNDSNAISVKTPDTVFPFSLELLGNENGGASFLLNGFDYEENIKSARFVAKDSLGVTVTDVTRSGLAAKYFQLSNISGAEKCLPWARQAFYPVETKSPAGIKYIHLGGEKPQIAYGIGSATCEVVLNDGRTATLGPVQFNNDPYAPLGALGLLSGDRQDNLITVKAEKLLNPIPNSALSKIFANVMYYRTVDSKTVYTYRMEWCEFTQDDANIYIKFPLNFPDSNEWKFRARLKAVISANDGKNYVTSDAADIIDGPYLGLPAKRLDKPIFNVTRWYKSSRPAYAVQGTFNLTPNGYTGVLADTVWVAIFNSSNQFIYAVCLNTCDTGILNFECMTKDDNITKGIVLKARLYAAYAEQLVMVESDVTYTVP